MNAAVTPDAQPVLILGAGINGSCVARELLLNGVPVVLADQEDISCGATSKSSRLIHGGLRYLEYGDVDLVRESLDERARLLQLAPQFVSPLRLFIPVRRRHGGLLQAGIRFLKLERMALGRWLARRLPVSERGLWAVRIGLTLYDWIARDGGLPPHSVGRIDQPGAPALDRSQFAWVCSYYDSQMLYPERFTLALLEDCRRIAAQQQVQFDVLPYHTAQRDGQRIQLRPLHVGETVALRPSTLVNASGAWGDGTLQDLRIDSPSMFAGTKGSHIISRRPALLTALGGDAVYAEASDGRLVFVLPFDDAVLIGTTDIPFAESPDRAVTTPDEVAYLVDIVNDVFPDVKLASSDVAAHYCGVRPLPNVQTSRAGAIPRGHSIETQMVDGLVIDTLIGGKLTTCRAFGEYAADRIMQRIGHSRTETTRDRPVPGSESHPTDAAQLISKVADIAHATGFEEAQVQAVWPLVGTRAGAILQKCIDDEHRKGLRIRDSMSREGDAPAEPLLAEDSPRASARREPRPPSHGTATGSLPGTALPIAFVDWVIEHEWVTTLDDLVERRLMLAWSAQLSVDLLQVIAERLVRAGRLQAGETDAAVASSRTRLASHYGRNV